MGKKQGPQYGSSQQVKSTKSAKMQDVKQNAISNEEKEFPKTQVAKNSTDEQSDNLEDLTKNLFESEESPERKHAKTSEEIIFKKNTANSADSAEVEIKRAVKFNTNAATTTSFISDNNQKINCSILGDSVSENQEDQIEFSCTDDLIDAANNIITDSSAVQEYNSHTQNSAIINAEATNAGAEDENNKSPKREISFAISRSPVESISASSAQSTLNSNNTTFENDKNDKIQNSTVNKNYKEEEVKEAATTDEIPQKATILSVNNENSIDDIHENSKNQSQQNSKGEEEEPEEVVIGGLSKKKDEATNSLANSAEVNPDSKLIPEIDGEGASPFGSNNYSDSATHPSSFPPDSKSIIPEEHLAEKRADVTTDIAPNVAANTEVVDTLIQENRKILKTAGTNYILMDEEGAGISGGDYFIPSSIESNLSSLNPSMRIDFKEFDNIILDERGSIADNATSMAGESGDPYHKIFSIESIIRTFTPNLSSSKLRNQIWFSKLHEIEIKRAHLIEKLLQKVLEEIRTSQTSANSTSFCLMMPYIDKCNSSELIRIIDELSIICLYSLCELKAAKLGFAANEAELINLREKAANLTKQAIDDRKINSTLGHITHSKNANKSADNSTLHQNTAANPNENLKEKDKDKEPAQSQLNAQSAQHSDSSSNPQKKSLVGYLSGFATKIFSTSE